MIDEEQRRDRFDAGSDNDFFEGFRYLVVFQR